MLFENFQKICTEVSVTEMISSKTFVLQNGLSLGRLSFSFPNTVLWLLPKIEQKRISLNDDIVWYKNSRVIKDLSNSNSFYLISVPKHFFILSTRKFHAFLKNIPHKKSIKLQRLLCKNKSPLKFHKCYS